MTDVEASTPTLDAHRLKRNWAELPLRRAFETDDPVLHVLLERAAACSRPGVRRDEHVVCLAVEGGAMRGSVSAGMCAALETLGLIPAFDRIYGCSAGALNGAFTAAASRSWTVDFSSQFPTARRCARGRLTCWSCARAPPVTGYRNTGGPQVLPCESQTRRSPRC